MNTKTITGILFLVFLQIPSPALRAQEEVKLYEAPLALKTYLVNPPDVNPFFFKGESYQGASKLIYPYALNDNLSNHDSLVEYKGLFVENEYIKACITPELGGKLYWAEDKTNHYNFFYKNNVVKPANIGMLGAWVSGGIEWCVFHHHRASTFLPVNYTLQENPDGSKTIWFGETEPRHRMKWTIGISVFPGKSYLQAEVKLINPTENSNSFLYWANVATHANKDYQVFFPPDTDFGADHSKVDFTHWPFSTEVYRGTDYTRGVDISYWKNHPVPTSIFCYDLRQDFMGGYDHQKNAGTVHVGNHNIVKGAKLWEWGPGELAQMWDRVLSDEDGPYAEIMVGAYSDNQPDYSWIKPFETKSFKQYWFPVTDIGGIKYANLHGALNLEIRDKNKLFFGLSVTEKFEAAKAIVTISGEKFFEQIVSISPGNAFTSELKLPKGVTETQLRVILQDRTGNELLSYQPKEHTYKKDLPEIVEPPADPKDYNSVEELYLAGLRLKQFYNPKKDAGPYFEEALKRDPGNSDVNTFLGNEALKNGDYSGAAVFFRKAIERLSKDYTRPENCQAYYGLGRCLKATGKYDDAVDTLYRAGWDHAFLSPSSLLLAEISCSRKDYVLALEQIKVALSNNSLNTRALSLEASIYRKLDQPDEAIASARKALATDPLDFRAANEIILSLKASGKSADQELDELEIMMRADHEYYLEIASAYLNAGLMDDARDILERYVERHSDKLDDPIINYWLWYLYSLNKQPEKAGQYQKKASGLPTDYCFPYRLETMMILEKVLQVFPADSRAHYYLGNLLYDKQPARAMYEWKRAVEGEPGLAIAHRNLGWAEYRFRNNIGEAIHHYEDAIKYKNDDPVYYYELDFLYELNNTDPLVRLKLLEPNHKTLMLRDDSFLREIMVLNLTGNSETAVRYLSENYFHIREGDMKIMDINVDAHLLTGLSAYEKGLFSEAFREFSLAVSFPSNQQVGLTPDDPRLPQINYFTGLALEAEGKTDEAMKYYNFSADQDIRDSEFSYYQGLSLLKMGEKEKASKIFAKLLESGKKNMEQSGETDVFAKFGETETRNTVLSRAHLKTGLALAGMGEFNQAINELKKAVELNAGNLWARVELKRLQEN